jgi:hypothetical protein
VAAVADDLMRMQRQAAQRVRQMQDHSRRVFEAYQGRAATPIGDSPWGEELRSPGLYARREETAVPVSPCPIEEPSCSPAPPAVTLPALDTEQWLLLGLAVLLWQSGCHTELMLALLHLAL